MSSKEDVVELSKIVPILFVLLLSLSLSSRANWRISVKASPDVIDVFPGLHPTIQEAINNASSGTTIFVHDGTYSEDIVVNKSVSLIGEDRDTAIIVGYMAINIISVTADNVVIRGFTIMKSITTPPYTGILISSAGNRIERNKIISNYDGLGLSQLSSNNVISDNILSDNQDGISLLSSINNVFSGNTILNSVNDGVSLAFSDNNIFSGNTFSNNLIGIEAYSSSNNTFFHNNLRDSVQMSGDSVNVWSYGGEGNFWINYTGQDLNGDGIGDTPHTITASNRDTYPLMGAYSEFDAFLGDNAYTVSIISNSTLSGFEFQIGTETGNKIVSFNVTGTEGTFGFSRVMIPTGLMSYPFIVIASGSEIVPTLLNVTDQTSSHLYFTYLHSSQRIAVISSKTLLLYNDLLAKYLDLNVTYYDLLNNYTLILQLGLSNLNDTYYILLNNYTILLASLDQLQNSYSALNSSYQNHLLDYSANAQNVQNLMYIFASTTAILLITVVYLSRSAHASARRKHGDFEETES
jgi:parallel beta-helix repeat protein